MSNSEFRTPGRGRGRAARLAIATGVALAVSTPLIHLAPRSFDPDLAARLTPCFFQGALGLFLIAWGGMSSPERSDSGIAFGDLEAAIRSTAASDPAIEPAPDRANAARSRSRKWIDPPSETDDPLGVFSLSPTLGLVTGWPEVSSKSDPDRDRGATAARKRGSSKARPEGPDARGRKRKRRRRTSNDASGTPASPLSSSAPPEGGAESDSERD